MFKNLLDGLAQRLRVEGLAKYVFDRVAFALSVEFFSTDEQERRRLDGGLLENLSFQLDSVHDRHHNVCDDQVDAVRGQKTEGLLSIRRLEDAVDRVLQRPEAAANVGPHVRIVVDDQDDGSSPFTFAGELVLPRLIRVRVQMVQLELQVLAQGTMRSTFHFDPAVPGLPLLLPVGRSGPAKAMR